MYDQPNHTPEQPQPSQYPTGGGYPPPPFTYQQTPPAAPAPRRRHRIRTAVIATVAGIVGISVIAGIAGSGDSHPAGISTPAASSSTSAAAVTNPPTPTPDATIDDTVADTETAAPPPPPAPRVLLDLHGDGISNSRPFTPAGQWTLAYSFDCTSFGNAGNFIVEVADDSGAPVAIPVNALARSGHTTTQVYESGQALHLEINSECTWHVRVTG